METACGVVEGVGIRHSPDAAYVAPAFRVNHPGRTEYGVARVVANPPVPLGLSLGRGELAVSPFTEQKRIAGAIGDGLNTNVAGLVHDAVAIRAVLLDDSGPGRGVRKGFVHPDARVARVATEMHVDHAVIQRRVLPCARASRCETIASLGHW